MLAREGQAIGVVCNVDNPKILFGLTIDGKLTDNKRETEMHVPFASLTPHNKLRVIIQQIENLSRLAKKDQKVIFFCRENAICGEDGKPVTEEFANEFIQSMLECSEKYPNVLIMPGTLSVTKRYNATIEEPAVVRDKLLALSQCYKQFDWIYEIEKKNSEKLFSADDKLKTHANHIQKLLKNPPKTLQVISNTSYAFCGGKIIHQLGKISPAIDELMGLDDACFQPPIREYSNPIFKWNNMEIGVEICKMHGYGQIDKVKKDKIPDLQVVIAKGLSEHSLLCSSIAGAQAIQVDIGKPVMVLSRAQRKEENRILIYHQNIGESLINAEALIKPFYPLQFKVMDLIDEVKDKILLSSSQQVEMCGLRRSSRSQIDDARKRIQEQLYFERVGNLGLELILAQLSRCPYSMPDEQDTFFLERLLERAKKIRDNLSQSEMKEVEQPPEKKAKVDKLVSLNIPMLEQKKISPGASGVPITPPVMSPPTPSIQKLTLLEIPPKADDNKVSLASPTPMVSPLPPSKVSSASPTLTVSPLPQSNPSSAQLYLDNLFKNLSTKSSPLPRTPTPVEPSFSQLFNPVNQEKNDIRAFIKQLNEHASKFPDRLGRKLSGICCHMGTYFCKDIKDLYNQSGLDQKALNDLREKNKQIAYHLYGLAHLFDPSCIQALKVKQQLIKQNPDIDFLKAELANKLRDIRNKFKAQVDLSELFTYLLIQTIEITRESLGSQFLKHFYTVIKNNLGLNKVAITDDNVVKKVIEFR